LLFAANGQPISDLKTHIVELSEGGVTANALKIDALSKKTDYREKDI
jgi:hypothetical protein